MDDAKLLQAHLCSARRGKKGNCCKGRTAYGSEAICARLLTPRARKFCYKFLARYTNSLVVAVRKAVAMLLLGQLVNWTVLCGTWYWRIR